VCHGYEMRWWRSETTAKKTTKEANPDVMRTLTARQDEKAKAVSEDKIEEGTYPRGVERGPRHD